MRTCSRCKSVEARRDGFCPDCRREYDRERYEADKGIGRSSSKWRYQQKWKVVQEVKSAPCTDCNHQYPWFVMEFDHVRGNKIKKVSRIMASGSMQALLDEIAKCEVVCANCHRLRTAKRAGWI